MIYIKEIRVIAAISLIAFLASCKKYPDGPLISLRSKEHRVAGDWNVSYFSINGNDSTSYLHANLLDGFYSFDKKDHDGYTYFSYNAYNHLYSRDGYWEFANNKKSIRIRMLVPSTHNDIFNLCLYNATTQTVWDIQRLTEKEMWLKGTYTDGREYYFKLSLRAD